MKLWAIEVSKLAKIITTQAFIQHHGTVQLHTAIHKLNRAPLGPPTTCIDNHCAWEK